jgi:hypothetical protein
MKWRWLKLRFLKCWIQSHAPAAPSHDHNPVPTSGIHVGEVQNLLPIVGGVDNANLESDSERAIGYILLQQLEDILRRLEEEGVQDITFTVIVTSRSLQTHQPTTHFHGHRQSRLCNARGCGGDTLGRQASLSGPSIFHASAQRRTTNVGYPFAKSKIQFGYRLELYLDWVYIFQSAKSRDFDFGVRVVRPLQVRFTEIWCCIVVIW